MSAFGESGGRPAPHFSQADRISSTPEAYWPERAAICGTVTSTDLLAEEAAPMATSNQLGSVEHLVVLMLENRSLDHMLGHLYADAGNVSPAGQPFDGLTGHESNPDASGQPVTAFAIDPRGSDVYFMPGANPGEGYVNTNLQLFGQSQPPKQPLPPVPTNRGFVTNFATTLAGADAHEPVVAGTVPADIMGMFTPELLPILSGLARGYAVCDRWFSSVPTMTLPNRAFLHAATSLGHMDDAAVTLDTQSIFGLMSEHGLDWSIYGYNLPPLTRMDFADTAGAAESHFGLFKDFQVAAASGNLPPYVFLEPSWGSSGNSQHPNYDVALGEQLIHDVYYTVRSSPAWEQILLIVTYDEHGGCYDHVPPPSGAIPPDNSAGQFGFDFTRFGVRVPAVLISPLIAPGTVFRPAGSVPLDHTSVLRTIESRWQLPPLTARDAAAPDVGDVLTLVHPRNDDPLGGVKVPTSRAPNPAAGTPSHLLRVYADLVAKLPLPDNDPARDHPVTEQEFDDYIRQRMAEWSGARPP
jgi:phospholipase C